MTLWQSSGMNTLPNVFTPAKLGPVTLHNRNIKAATFEASTPNALVTDDLITYHRLLAAGGVGMTTVAYLAVSPGGRTEGRQIWWRREAVPGLQELTAATHAEARSDQRADRSRGPGRRRPLQQGQGDGRLAAGRLPWLHERDHRLLANHPTPTLEDH
jgi:hypothetical protein